MNNTEVSTNKTIRIVFAGTPDFAVPSLVALTGPGGPVREIVAVYTQPDRPAGRGRKLRQSDIKKLATEIELPVMQPMTLRDADTQHTLRELEPDLMIVAAYGLILPQAVLDIPRFGCVNVHASLLPRWRGAAPVQRAMLAGDERTGVTLMQMNAGLDTGEMLAHRDIAIDDEITGGELSARLAQLGADLLLDKLGDLLAGQLQPVPQNDSQATLAPKIKKSEARIDWGLSAAKIARQVRAFNPWPVAETVFRGHQLRIWSAHAIEAGNKSAPGTVISAEEDSICVATGDGALVVDALQPAGKRVMTARDFLNAHEIEGDVLGPADDSG